MSFILALFSAVAVQKNIRDTMKTKEPDSQERKIN
jgi:uncharacterized membrane protein YiaA